MQFMTIVLQSFFDICAVVYFDNILIYSQKNGTHCQHLQMVLEALHSNKLHLNMKNFQLAMMEVKLLGIIVDQKGLQMDLMKISAL